MAIRLIEAHDVAGALASACCSLEVLAACFLFAKDRWNKLCLWGKGITGIQPPVVDPAGFQASNSCLPVIKFARDSHTLQGQGGGSNSIIPISMATPVRGALSGAYECLYMPRSACHQSVWVDSWHALQILELCVTKCMRLCKCMLSFKL